MRHALNTIEDEAVNLGSVRGIFSHSDDPLTPFGSELIPPYSSL